jgi:hypothetical protein
VKKIPGAICVQTYRALHHGSFSYFFRLETFPSQALMWGILSKLLGLTILAILELAHRYQGAVVVSDAPSSSRSRE